MVVFPNCKINLGLNVIRKREDGYHDIETVFYPIKLLDVLEVVESNDSNTSIKFTGTGLTVEGNEEDNLCLKAYQLLKKELPQLPAVQIQLHKTIPMGAGLGGGSSDGSFTLTLLNDKFNLGLSTPQLLDHAAALGSDGPFFIINKPCFATGRGEVLEEINVDLSPYTIVLVNPGIHIPTRWAFTQINPSLPRKQIKDIIAQPIAKWKDELKNDFEEPVFEKYPELTNIKEGLYNQGALYAAMSGSGSTVFGIFDKAIPVPLFPDTNYYEHIIK